MDRRQRVKAIILKEIGNPGELYYEETTDPFIKEGHVLVKLHAAAVNRRDLFIRYGQYPGIKLPSILGADGSGEIVEVGEGVKNVQNGQKVVINPTMNWGDHPDYAGPNFSVLGVPIDGTYAQYISIPKENVFQKPDHLSFEEAAAIPLGGVTAFRAAVTRGQIKPGESVIIPGIGGGVATFVLQIAAALGAKVFVTSSSEEKIQKAINMGAAGGVNYKESTNWVKELKEMSGGADLAVDSIGGDVFNDLITLAKPASRIVSFGATKGPVEKLVMPRIFFKQLNIFGSTMGSPNEFQQMLNFWEALRIHPVIDEIFELSDAAEAHKKIDQGANFGKLVLSIPH